MNKSSILEKLQQTKIRAISIVVEKITARVAKSYSFYGEDVVIKGMLERYQFVFNKNLNISYVDVGAWRPIRGSNTYFLYKMGQYGTVVEPNPHFKNLWKHLRPRDLYLENGCGSDDNATLRIFHRGAASNSYDVSFVGKIQDSQNVAVTETIVTKMKSLDSIIREHMLQNPQPFLLDLDIEGMDLEVLSKFSFKEELKPLIIMVEDSGPQISANYRLEIQSLLEKENYVLMGRTVLTGIYVRENSELSELWEKVK